MTAADKVPVVGWLSDIRSLVEHYDSRVVGHRAGRFIRRYGRVLATDYEAAIARAEAAEALLRQVIDAHTGENIDGCGMTNAQLSEIAAQQAGG